MPRQKWPDRLVDTVLLERRGWPLRYAAALVFTGLALALTGWLSPYLGGRVFMFSFAAVAVSGALGLGPGLLAALTCILGVDYMFLRPTGELGTTRPADLLALMVFFVVSLLISGLASRLRRANIVAHDRQIELEKHAADLARAEASNRAIVESLGDPMVVHDSKWRFQYINAAAAEIYKTSPHKLPDSLIGHSVWELFPASYDNEFGKNMRRAMDERVPINFEGYNPERGQWSEVRSFPVPDGGLVTVWKNVTERHQTAEAQRYLAEASKILGSSLEYEATLESLARLVVPDLADWCRIDMLQDDGSVRLLTVTHRDPEKVKWAEELARKYPTDPSAPSGTANVLRTGQAEIYPDITEEMLAGGIDDPEFLALLKTVQFKGVIIAPIASPNGVVGAITLVSAESRRRYTERDLGLAVELGRRAGMAVENARVHHFEKIAREAAVEAKQSAEEANAAKSQFLAFMSHELRTPLNAIAGYVDLILAGVHGPVTPAQHQALDRVKRSQHALLGLINNVLNFARLDAGHVDLSIHELPASEIMSLVEPLVVPQLEAKGLQYKFGCDDGARVRADAEKTQQILLNLVSNAIKFTDSGGQVTVDCQQDTEYVLFSVSDTGRGIASEKQTAIFEPFVQLDRTLRSAHEGVGLGLAISRDLALQMKGKLEVESEVGRGSRFILSLPSA